MKNDLFEMGKEFTDQNTVGYTGTLFGAQRMAHELYDLDQWEIYKGNDAVKCSIEGVEMQSRYCKTGSEAISECFQDGKFECFTSDGKLIQIEVPSDKYEDALKAMEEGIRDGQVSGVSDPDQAEMLIKKGSYTYEQVRNVARFGTVESLVYDARTGAVFAVGAFGISAIITYAFSIWSGVTREVAFKNAFYTGLKIGGVTFVTSIISKQLARTRVYSGLQGTTDLIVKKLGSNLSAQVVNSLRSGSKIYGTVAMKNLSKLLRGYIISGTVIVAVLSALDAVQIFRRKISVGQLFKNVATTVTGVGGGTIGWIGGATLGATLGSAVPIIGTVAGSLVGGFIGAFGAGTVASSTTKVVLDQVIRDDAKVMLDMIEQEFAGLTQEYLLTKEEGEQVVSRLADKLNLSVLREMFSSSDRRQFARDLLTVEIEDVVKTRESIPRIDEKEMLASIQDLPGGNNPIDI